MEISLNARHGYYLVFKTESVTVEEDIEERIYSKTEDGKTDFSKPPKRDVSTASLDQITSVLEDLIYCRRGEYDSSSLIERLFEKLPEDSVKKMLSKLNRDYEINQDDVEEL